MKIRASLVLALLVICASAVQAQSTCCAMIVGPQNITRQSTLIAASQGSVWTYTSSATAITPIGCVNTSKSDAPCIGREPFPERCRAGARLRCLEPRPRRICSLQP
jgi:hypothetical protein